MKFGYYKACIVLSKSHYRKSQYGWDVKLCWLQYGTSIVIRGQPWQRFVLSWVFTIFSFFLRKRIYWCTVAYIMIKCSFCAKRLHCLSVVHCSSFEWRACMAGHWRIMFVMTTCRDGEWPDQIANCYRVPCAYLPIVCWRTMTGYFRRIISSIMRHLVYRTCIVYVDVISSWRASLFSFNDCTCYEGSLWGVLRGRAALLLGFLLPSRP